MNHRPDILVVGIGNDFRSDDAAGLVAARQITALGLENIEVLTGVSDGTSLLNAWENRRLAIIIDAVHSGQKAGRIYCFDGLRDNIPENIFSSFSTHAFRITETIALGRAIGQLPEKLTVYGIEGACFGTGCHMSAEVTEAVAVLLEDMKRNLTAIKK